MAEHGPFIGRFPEIGRLRGILGDFGNTGSLLAVQTAVKLYPDTIVVMIGKFQPLLENVLKLTSFFSLKGPRDSLAWYIFV